MLSRSPFCVVLLSLVWTGLLLSTVHASAVDISPRSPLSDKSASKSPVAPVRNKKRGGVAEPAYPKKLNKKKAATSKNKNKCYGDGKPSLRKRTPASNGKGSALDSCGIGAIVQHSTCKAGAISVTFPSNKLVVQPGKADGAECDMIYDMTLLAYAMHGVCINFQTAIGLIAPHIDPTRKEALLTKLKSFIEAAVKKVAYDKDNHRFLSKAELDAKQKAFADFTEMKPITKDQTMKNVAEYLSMDLSKINSKVSGWRTAINGEMEQMRSEFMKEYAAAKPEMCDKDDKTASVLMQSLKKKEVILVSWNDVIKEIGVTESKPIPKEPNPP